MEHAQQLYIEEQLDKHVICSVKDKHTARIEDISTPLIHDILSNDTVSGSDMCAVLNMFETLFLASGTKNKGMISISKSIKEWMTDIQKLDVDSNQGYVFVSKIFGTDTKVIIKVPRKNYGFFTALREYFMGIFAINNLRYRIPNFVFTLGGFMCPKPKIKGNKYKFKKNGSETAFVIYEYLSGENITMLLKKKRLSFETWLISFAQILLALEVAQLEINFTHFDLHGGNVMLIEQGTSYDIPLGDQTYKIINPPSTPVIIDYGLSTCEVKNKTIGSFDFSKYGMMHYMVQGYDMYKFLVYSTHYAKDIKVRRKIQQLFYFYGQKDPYRVLFDSKGITKAIKEYCTKASFTSIATYTPLMFFKWIMGKEDYRKILSPYIHITPRKEYIPVQYSVNIHKYDDIFNYNSEKRKKALEIASNCIVKNPSYILAKYTLNILKKYNYQLYSTEFKEKIDELDVLVNDDILIIDNLVLENVFDIEVPLQKNLLDISRVVLKVGIDSSDQEKKIAIDAINSVNICKELAPYLQQYYTILELNLTEKFQDWIDRFRSSDIFIFYSKNNDLIERLVRWQKTLFN